MTHDPLAGSPLSSLSSSPGSSPPITPPSGRLSGRTLAFLASSSPLAERASAISGLCKALLLDSAFKPGSRRSLPAASSLAGAAHIDGPQGADLRTSSTPEAQKHAFASLACILGSVAHAAGPLMDPASFGATGPLGAFNATLDCIETIRDTHAIADPALADKLLDSLSALLNKGFHTGVGCMQYPGFPPDDVVPAPTARDKLTGLIAYYRLNAAEHFTPSPTRHRAGVDLATVQLLGTVGQLFNDFALDPRVDTRGVITGSMQAAFGIDHAGFGEISSLKTSLRGNPLLAEVSNKKILREITDALGTPVRKDCVITAIRESLETTEPAGSPLTVETTVRISSLAVTLAEKFIEKMSSLEIHTVKSGGRGRMTMLPFRPLTGDPAADAVASAANKVLLKDFGETILGTPGVGESFALMPHRADDLQALELATGLLTISGSDPLMTSFNAAVSGEHILHSDGVPMGALRLSSGLDTSIKSLANNPQEILLRAIDDMPGPLTLEDDLILKRLAASLSGPAPALKDALQAIIIGTKNADGEYAGGIPVTFNEGSPVTSTISLGSFVEMKSVASLLAKNDLRAVCSISGTTIDMVLGSLSTAGNVARMKTLLKPLNDHAHALYMYKKALANPVLGAAPAGAPPVMPNEPEFQKLFTAISFFMQSGQYHSSGEVLGGLFIASMTLAAHGNLPAAPPADPAMLADYTALSEAKRRSSLIQETYDTFDALAADFAQHPENYFALDAVDKAKLITPEFKTAIQTLKEADLDRITGP